MIVSLQAQNGTFFNAQQLASGDNSAILGGSAAIYANPAGILAQNQTWDLSLSAVNLFSTDIFGFTGAASYKTSAGAFGLSLGQYGIDGFQSSNLGIAFSRELGKDAYLGVKANWFQRRIEGIESSQQPDFSLGYWQRFNGNLILSFTIKNPMQKTNERIATGKIDLAIAYGISEQLYIFSAIEKPWNQELSVNPGLKYSPSKAFSLYISTSTSTNSMAFGSDLGINDQLVTTIAIRTHNTLGNSAGFSLRYLIN